MLENTSNGNVLSQEMKKKETMEYVKVLELSSMIANGD